MPKTCPQCQSQAPDDANNCGSCGAPLQPGAPAPQGQPVDAAGQAPPGSPGVPPPAPTAGGQAAPGAALGSYNFDLARLSLADRIAAIATFVLFISLFLPWFTATYKGLGGISASDSVNGLWHAWLYLTLILCIAIITYLVAKAGWDELPISGMSLPHLTVMLVATIVNFALVFIAFIDKPGGLSFGPYGGVSIGWGFGAILGLLASLVAAAPYVVPQLRAKTMG